MVGLGGRSNRKWEHKKKKKKEDTITDQRATILEVMMQAQEAGGYPPWEGVQRTAVAGDLCGERVEARPGLALFCCPLNPGIEADRAQHPLKFLAFSSLELEEGAGERRFMPARAERVKEPGKRNGVRIIDTKIAKA